MPEQLEHAGLWTADRLRVLIAFSLGQPAPDPEDDDRERRADRERNPPAPRVERLFRHDRLKHEEHRYRCKLASDQCYVLERREETSTLLAGHLREVGRACAIFAADRQPL